MVRRGPTTSSFATPTRFWEVKQSAQRQPRGSWKLSAVVLGILTWVLAGIALAVIDPPPPWTFVYWAAVVLLILAIGTFLFVPRASSTSRTLKD